MSLYETFKITGESNAKNLNMTAVNNNLQDLRENFFHLQEIFNISESLKMRIIFNHYEEYFEKIWRDISGSIR